MRKLNLTQITLLILTVFMFGCTETKKKTESELLDNAKAKYDEKNYDESVGIYREFIKEYPKSDKAVFAYNQIAGIQIDAQKNHLEGIKTYKELAEKFPATKEAKQALFMVAFIYDETLKDKTNAITAYETFLQKYPTDSDANDKMSESARTMLELLKSGKPIEEIIQQNIEKMGGQSSADSGKVKGEDANPDPSGETPKKIESKKPSQPNDGNANPNQKKAGDDPAKDTKTEN